MAAAFQTWTVLPHGPLIEVDDNILTVVGDIKMPGGLLPRRMTLVRLADGRLIVFSAIALDEREMDRVEAFGARRSELPTVVGLSYRFRRRASRSSICSASSPASTS